MKVKKEKKMLGSWDDFGQSIFSTMTEEANKAGAINLAQGFPDFDGPSEIIDEAVAALRSGFNQYAPSRGYRDLRLAIVQYIAKRKNLHYHPDTEISVFSGASEALFCAIMAFCQKGDELLTFEPFFDVYPGVALAAGASFKTLRLNLPHWDFDLDALKRAISPKTRVLLLNTPNNPSGKVFSRGELDSIASLAIQHDLLVITDEVYEEIIFEPNQHICIAQLPGMRERSIVISSASKTFSLTGWKVGYATACETFLNRMRTVHEHIVFCSASPLQKAITKAYHLPDRYFFDLKSEYSQKKNLLMEVLEECGFHCINPQGSYFIVADYSAISEKNDREFSIWLTREAKIACIPLSVFFQDQEMQKRRLVRFCFAKTFPTLMESATRLRSFFEKKPSRFPEQVF
jgi:N-succinyldiaminopimelate aminotransferase